MLSVEITAVRQPLQIDYFGRGGKPPELPPDAKKAPPGQTAKQEPQA